MESFGNLKIKVKNSEHVFDPLKWLGQFYNEKLNPKKLRAARRLIIHDNLKVFGNGYYVFLDDEDHLETIQIDLPKHFNSIQQSKIYFPDGFFFSI